MPRRAKNKRRAYCLGLDHRNKAIETAAKHYGYSRSKVYEIVNIREGKVS